MTPPARKLDPRKSPLQGRSQATCAAILEAAARILETDGRNGLTTNHVAERAGVSVGSLYQYFPGKEAILAELIRRMRQDMLDDFETAAREAAGRDLSAAVSALVRASVQHHLRRPALAEALEREEAELPLDGETKALKTRMRAVLVRILEEWGMRDVETTAFDLIALCRGITGAAVQAGERDFEAIVRRLERAVNGYLAADPVSA